MPLLIAAIGPLISWHKRLVSSSNIRVSAGLVFRVEERGSGKVGCSMARTETGDPVGLFMSLTTRFRR